MSPAEIIGLAGVGAQLVALLAAGVLLKRTLNGLRDVPAKIAVLETKADATAEEITRLRDSMHAVRSSLAAITVQIEQTGREVDRQAKS